MTTTARSLRAVVTRGLAVLGSLALTLGLTAVAAPAQAVGTGYRLSYATVGKQAIVVRWNPCQAAITYKVNLRFAGPDHRRALRDVKGAVSRLSHATGMRFRYEGGTGQIPTGTGWYRRQTSTEIVIAWTPRSRTSLLERGAAGEGGYVYKTYSTRGRTVAAIGRGYLLLDAAQRSEFRPGFGRGVTRGSLLLHELGHVVGLNHVSSRSQTMHPVIVSRSRASYKPGDRAGLRRSGRPAGCTPVPRGIWRQV